MIERFIPKGTLAASVEEGLLGGVDRVNQEADVFEKLDVDSTDIVEPFEVSIRFRD